MFAPQTLPDGSQSTFASCTPLPERSRINLQAALHAATLILDSLGAVIAERRYRNSYPLGKSSIFLASAQFLWLLLHYRSGAALS